MTLAKVTIRSMVYLSLIFWNLPMHATKVCDFPELLHQEKDAATVQHLENTWSIAFLRGNTELMRCLLVPEFTEITRSGQLKVLSDELVMTAKNQGKDLPIPDLPKATVLLHNNVAVAYGESRVTGPDGKAMARRFADFFLWEDGKWHAFFSSQTPEESH
ncbi:MAG: nuclear transport factor 2 family protein [Terriglobales bacterium]